MGVGLCIEGGAAGVYRGSPGCRAVHAGHGWGAVEIHVYRGSAEIHW